MIGIVEQYKSRHHTLELELDCHISLIDFRHMAFTLGDQTPSEYEGIDLIFLQRIS